MLPVFEAMHFLFLIKAAQIFALVPIIAVMFTFSFSSAFAGTFEAKTSDEKTALITVAQTELAASKDYLDTVKAYYLKNFEELALDDTAYEGVTVKKAAIEKIIDDVFADINKAVTLVYNDVIIGINGGEVPVADNDAPTLADAKAVVKAAIKDEYTKYTADKINGIIKGDADYVKAAAEAQFDVVKADALATLDKVNFGNYSTTVPDAPTYDSKYYYSNQKIAQTIVDNAKDAIAKIKFDKDDAEANIAAIKSGLKKIVDETVVEDADTEGLYYVLTDGKVEPAALETDSDLVKRSATEAKEERTLAEEKTYQVARIEGLISLKVAEARKELNSLLEDEKDKDVIKFLEDFLANLNKYADAAKEVAAARINYVDTTPKAVADKAAELIEEFNDNTAKYNDDAVDWLDSLVKITEKVDALEAEAAKLKAQTGFNGAPLYDAAEIEDALEEAIEEAYNGALNVTVTGKVNPNEDLVKLEMKRVLGMADPTKTVTLDKVVYPVVAGWMDETTFADGAKYADADKIIRETVDAIRAAKTVEDVDAAFVAGYEKFKAVPTEDDFKKFQNADATKEAAGKYAAKLAAALVEKKADYGTSKFDKDYPAVGEDFLNNLCDEYLVGAYSMDELAAGYEKALAEIKNLKTKAELEAEQKAINDAILAIKAPVKEADEATVLALAKRVNDFKDYQKLLGLVSTSLDNEGKTVYSYDYTVYDGLLGKYVETLKDLAEDKLDDAEEAIEKGGITVDDEAAITEYEKMVKEHLEKYYVLAGMSEEVVDAVVAMVVADYKAALVEAKADEVEAAIAKIDASAKPLDVAAIKAAREAYDALGEAGVDLNQAMYHKLLSLENLAKAESIAAVESLKIKASSSAKKGSITVKWTVKGDKAAADGYQLYKSTKAQKGYKKCITTKKTSFKNTKNLKKGTRYYYKVSAYVVIDGVTYYSDWSNKANRVAL